MTTLKDLIEQATQPKHPLYLAGNTELVNYF